MKKLSIIASLLLLMLTVIPALAAEEDAPPGVADMWVVTPKDGQSSEFEAAFKAHIAFRAENGDTRAWQTYTVIAGDDMNKYYVRYCCINWADQDAYTGLEQNKGMQKHWNDNVDQHVSSYEHYFADLDLENSNWPANAGEFAFYGVTSWTPRPGTGTQRGAAIAEFKAIATEHGWDKSWSWSWRIGGDSQLSLVIPYNDYAAMAPPEPTFSAFVREHIGEEAAAELFERFSSSFWGSSYTVYAHRPDLSMSDGDE